MYWNEQSKTDSSCKEPSDSLSETLAEVADSFIDGAMGLLNVGGSIVAKVLESYVPTNKGMYERLEELEKRGDKLEAQVAKVSSVVELFKELYNPDNKINHKGVRIKKSESALGVSPSPKRKVQTTTVIQVTPVGSTQNLRTNNSEFNNGIKAQVITDAVDPPF